MFSRRKEAIITHYSDRDLIESTGRGPIGVVAGVEAVMRSQREILQSKGWDVETIVGAGNLGPGVKIYSPIQSGNFVEKPPSGSELQEMTSSLRQLFSQEPVIAHNTTNGRRHNPAYAEAVARLAEERIDLHQAPIILWSHDIRGANLEDLFRFLPHRRNAIIVCVSNTRREELIRELDAIKKQHPDVPLPHEIQIMYNPINPLYLQKDVPKPNNLDQLAPNFRSFTHTYDLPQTYMDTETAIFHPEKEQLTLIIPARIVEQKGIRKALHAADAVGRLREGKKTTLIISGPPDNRKPENVAYWQNVVQLVKSGNFSHVQVTFLAGVAGEYMPWLLKQTKNGKKAIMLPSQNEGFGLPPSEAACVGTPSLLTDLPAFIETTQGLAFLEPLSVWQQPSVIAKKIVSYLDSGKPNHDVRALRALAQQKYAPAVIGKQLEKLLLHK